MGKFKNSCIIDDDPISVFGIKRSMKETNFTDDVVVYTNGQEALDGLTKMLNEGKKLPSIIFLDLNMPIMDGWEFLDDFIKIPNTNTEKVIIFIVSSSMDPRDMIKAQSYSMVNNYILKPILRKDLVRLMSELDIKQP
ncbi:response regulator [Arenibacter aquaticus]|uniref:Response regulator n=1 Tax=Arenibacter aquaticus TaxID=2489054 RepID=A0A3S0AFS4_9FLAO|nr:response regulator [Arenibacter aquaticus]RTE54677.1 response regulator [Arenibacter aquaticus]